MKIVQINTFSNGSTGNIMMNIHKELLNQGVDSYVIWGRGRKSQNQNEIFMNDKFGVYFHALYARITGKVGFASKKATKKIIKKLEEIKPDIIHLHNLHGYYINIELLFNYIKKNHIKVVWTLHDCWAFTGQCPHFTMKNCNKWKKQCFKCHMINEYPKTIKDNSYWNYNKKKKIFSNLNLTIVTPSEWLYKLVKKSFLKEYNVDIINNGINLNIFKPTKSDFKKKYGIESKRIILGVASVWDERKGLNDFLKLSKIIDDNYVIVLVGLNKKQIKKLPKNIIGITKTENQTELAGIYTAADVFLNLTYEDNYPTVNLESLACETPVLSYNTGGSTEFVKFIKEDKENSIIEQNISPIYKKNILKKITKAKINLKNRDLLSEKNMINSYLKIYRRKHEEE